MSLCENEDLERFLRNVDHISDLMKELNSSDESTQEKALEKADQFISSQEENETCRTRLNRTVINKSSSSESRPTNASDEPSQSPENFMKAFEEDADERRKRRQVKEELAKALKEKGNKAFAQGEYEVAVKFYTEGLEQLRDMQALYTNRAQALIKLEKYKEAISDCEWALKCSERCIKAHVHMGRAHLALKNFTESRICFEKILDIEPERGDMVKDYLSRVDQEQKKALEEKAVRDKLIEGKEGITAVPDLLIKLDRPDQSVSYYCRGVQLLSEAIKDSTGQTLFRLNNGFSIISGNNAVSSCLTQTSEEPNSEELCVSVLTLWRAVCCGNEENQQLLLQCSSRREQIVQLLDSAASAALRQACLNLLCLFCETQYGRGLVTENLDLHSMVKNMMDCLCRNMMSGTTALAVLEKLAGEHKFRVQFRETFAEVFAAPFEHLLENISVSSQDLLPSLISVIGAMCRDEVISRELGSREEFWKRSFSVVGRCAGCEYRRVLYPLLGLMINVSHNPAPVIREHAVEICSRCVVLLSDADGGIITRAAGLLSKILPKSAAAVQEVVQQGVVKRLLKILKGAGEISSRYSITALAACTASSLQASEELVKFDKRLVTVRMLLGSSDEVVVGNAALCLGHCSAVPGAAAGLLDTDCTLLLLRRAAGDAERAAVQQNAAIALGKICRAEPRHMLKLRELHYLEILHSCMKLVT